MSQVSDDRDIFFEEDDLKYEEEILRNPYSVKSWLRYAEYKKEGRKEVLNLIFERALKELPGSYKLWYNYLLIRRKQVEHLLATDPALDQVDNVFERSLVFMHKMPRIWLEYCKFLMDRGQITKTRRTFDRALRSLPVTQHDRIWSLYLAFVQSNDVPELACRIFRRCLKLMPEKSEDYIDYLISVDRLDEAGQLLANIINDEDHASANGKSKHQLWNDLCELISKNPGKIHSLKVEPIIRQGIKRYTDQVGVLWNSLADYYIRNGHFEKARDVYEEAIKTVKTVRDFTQVFDVYAQFEENMATSSMEADAAVDDAEIDLRLARLEWLMERRPLLLNSVLLRQNPHNVLEWHKRIELYEGKSVEIVKTFTEAVQTVDPKLATGKLYTLWVEFAKFYEKADQISDARNIFEKSITVNFKYVDDLASIWCAWAEMELRHHNPNEALKLLQRATTPPKKRVNYHDETETVQNRLHKSLKLWSLYADLEESFGTFKRCKAVYDRIIDLRIATPQIIINYGLYLEENNYYEYAFKAYEKGLALFKWPNVFDIWNTYLTKFINRYGGKKLERARDLFEQCLEYCPPKFAKCFYLLYSKLEENHGLARHAMAIYDRACTAVLPEEQPEMFNIYIRRAAEIYGVSHTRSIYEKAIDVLTDKDAREFSLKFADLERKLGEIDRARAIYAHASQMCDPRITLKFWKTWKEFEIKHGNEDTVREMLRVKRSVQATYNTQVNFMSSQISSVNQNEDDDEEDEMRKLEKRARELAEEEVKSQTKEKNINFISSEENPKKVEEKNPEELDIDWSDDDDEATESSKVTVEKQFIPDEVYGGLKKDIDETIV
ncbi:DgyrCDS12102 [Dimorphilus gyrociliatus]|uniref:DgyrCDS12102 n=1 Tax=Dimorphilus gyrociliatus TaxID=2664684 RepID=A0A7I8W8H0_9ANNE|nr:DgyrCDS12102 [Dimorphilus gyrociliatus]